MNAVCIPYSTNLGRVILIPETAGDDDLTIDERIMLHQHETIHSHTGTLATLVSIIDDPDFDASDPDCVRDLVQYLSVQCRAVSGV